MESQYARLAFASGRSLPTQGTAWAPSSVRAFSARGLAWAVGIPNHQKVYPHEVELIFPVAGRGRPRKRHVPNILSVKVDDMLTQAKWRTLAWRKGTKGPSEGPLRRRPRARRRRAAPTDRR